MSLSLRPRLLDFNWYQTVPFWNKQDVKILFRINVVHIGTGAFNSIHSGVLVEIFQNLDLCNLVMQYEKNWTICRYEFYYEWLNSIQYAVLFVSLTCF